MQTRTRPTWQQHLAALPEVDAPEALWSRIEAARRRPRSWRGPLVAGAAAAMFAAVVVGPSLQSVAPPAAPASAAMAIDSGLRRLDDDIALAYARDASEAELAALWQARERLLVSLDGAEPALLARL